MLLLIFLGFHFSVAATDELLITLKSGPVRGLIRYSYNNSTFISFEGIPYARPPIAQLRFQEPQPVVPWTDQLIANKTFKCVQVFPLAILSNSIQGQEDCLYINVYVPGERILPNANLSVVVHIHGGAFILGSPKMMAGPAYVMNKEVIYVTFNYRLGIFGFLSTGDEVVPGNNGLKDQNFALRWIRNNIATFGGNPESITLTGQSAGSSSVYFHYLSPKSKGLFHRGWCLSGSPLNPWSLVEKPRQKAFKLGNLMNCSADTSTDLVRCLKEKSAVKLGLAIKEFFMFANIIPVAPFGPVVEYGSDPFLSEQPARLLEKGNLSSDVPLIMSCVKDEGIYPVGALALFGKINDINYHWNEIMPYALDIQDTVDNDKKAEVVTKVRQHYLDMNDLDVNKLVKLFSDRYYFNGIQETARLHAKVSKAPIYIYFYSYQSTQIQPFPKVKGKHEVMTKADPIHCVPDAMNAPHTGAASKGWRIVAPCWRWQMRPLLVIFVQGGKY